MVLVTAAAFFFGYCHVRSRTYPAQHEAGLALAAKGVKLEWEPAKPAWFRAVMRGKMGDEVLRDCVAVNAKQARLSDSDLVHLGQMPHLKRLYLERNPITDQGLEHLRGLQELERLSLWGTKITDDGLPHVGQLRSLRVLDIHDASPLLPYYYLGVSSGSRPPARLSQNNVVYPPATSRQLTATCLKHLEGLHNLRAFYFSFPLEDEDLARLSAFDNLKIRTLVVDRVSAAGLAYVSQLRDLQMLVVAPTKIKSGGLRHLRKLPNLRYLKLRGVRVDGDGWQALRELTQITDLELDASLIDPSALINVGQLQQLQRLSLEGTLINDGDVVHLASLTNLRELRLPSVGVSADCLRHLIGMQQLETLHFSGGLDDEAIHCLAQLPGLKRLIGRSPRQVFVTKKGLEELAALKYLREVEIHDAATQPLPGGCDVPAGARSIDDGGLACLWDACRYTLLTIRGGDVTTAGIRWAPELRECHQVRIVSPNRTLAELVPTKVGIGAGEVDFTSGPVRLIAAQGIGPRTMIVDFQTAHFCPMDILRHTPDIVKLKFRHHNHLKKDSRCDWEQLRYVPKLQEFEMPLSPFTQCKLDAVGIRYIGKMKDLKFLSCIVAEGITPEEFAPLGQLQNLLFLTIHLHRVTPEHMRTIGKLTNLRSLHIIGTPDPDRDGPIGVEHLVNLSKLFEVQLYGVRDADVEALTRMKSLHRIVLKRQIVHEQLYDQLRALPALETLTVDGSGCTPDQLEELRRRLPKTHVGVN